MDWFHASTAADSQSDTQASELIFLTHWQSSDWDLLLEYTQTQMFSPGSIVLRAGAEDRALYIVAFGRLKVLVNRNKRLSRFKSGSAKKPALVGVVESGSVINELTFLDNKPGIATYQALVETQLIYLSYDSFNLFATLYPELARAVLQDLGRLLALKTRTLTDLLSHYTE
jgi:CRP-like cAMP-binding protein